MTTLDTAIKGIIKIIEKDPEAICKLSDYTCEKWSAPDAKLMCGTQWCKDKLLNDIITMGDSDD